MKDLILYNGRIQDSTISISPYSQGLNYGKGFFETLLYRNRVICLWAEHLRRLSESLKFFGLTAKTDCLKIEDVYRLIEKRGLSDKTLRIKILCAPLESGLDHLIYVMEYSPREDPMSAAIHREPFERFLGRFKSLNYFESLYWKDHYSRLTGSDEVLFTGRMGGLLEGSFTNILYVKDSELYYTAPENLCLPGTLQAFILKHHRAIGFSGIRMVSHGIPVEALLSAHETLLTNSLMIARPLTTLITPGGKVHTLEVRGWARKVRTFFLKEIV